MLRQIENHADSSRWISWGLGKHEWFQMASKYIEWHPILLAMMSCSACPHMVLYWRLGQGVTFLFGAISVLVALERMIIFIHFHCLHSSPYWLRFYLEFIQIQEKSQMDKELEYRKYVADARPLMKRCQGMQSLISFGTCWASSIWLISMDLRYSSWFLTTSWATVWSCCHSCHTWSENRSIKSLLALSFFITPNYWPIW